jgi:predicted amidophosphoribosyltransferase
MPRPAFVGLLGTVLDAVLPQACAGCAAPGGALCLACRDELAACAPGRRDPTPRPRGLPPVVAAAPYAGVARHALLAYKERGRTRLAEPLARLLAAAVATAWVAAAGPPRPIVLVGVPSSRSARRARGHDHVVTLATAAAGMLRRAGVPARTLRAARRRPTRRDSTELDAAARAHNAQDAFVVRRQARARLRGRTVLVVDDVVTTGSTAAALVAALESAGARVLAVAAVAATQRRCLVTLQGEGLAS